MFTKALAVVATASLALMGSVAPAQSAKAPAPTASHVKLGDIRNMDTYQSDVHKLAKKTKKPAIAKQFDKLLKTPVKGYKGTPAQHVLATPGLEKFFKDYSKVTGYSVSFERNLFACHVDNKAKKVKTCIEDLYTAMYDN